MGIKTLWTHLDHACAVTTLQEEAWRCFGRSPHRALRLGVDASAWVFHAEPMYIRAGPNPLGPIRTLFFRLSNLYSLPILPVFVFDGPERPRTKHGSTRPTGLDFNKHPLVRDFRILLRSFGFVDWDAPGEAEAELAWMNQAGLVDVVLTDDVDSLVFGATKVMRNFSMSDVREVQRRKQRLQAARGSQSSTGCEMPEDLNFVNLNDNKWGTNPVGLYTFPQGHWPDPARPQVVGWSDPTPSVPLTHEEEECDFPLDRQAILLTAALTGGDYNVQGVSNVGMTISKVLASLGFGQRIVSALVSSLQGSSDESRMGKVPTYDRTHWRPRLDLDLEIWAEARSEIVEDMMEELQTNSSGLLKTKKASAAQGLRTLFESKEDQEILGLYIWPRTTHLKWREGNIDDIPEITFAEEGGVTGIKLSSVEEELLRCRVSPRFDLNAPSKQFQSLDLAHLLYVLRKQFNWTDDKIRQRVQSTVAPGLLLRLLRDEMMSASPALGGHPLIAHQPPPTPSKGKRAPRSPSPAASLDVDPLDLATECSGLINLLEVIRERSIGERTEFRVRYDDGPLDRVVRGLLAKMPRAKDGWEPPPIPRKMVKTAPPKPVSAGPPMAQSEDGNKPRAAAAYHPEPRLMWIDARPLESTCVGKKLVDQFRAKERARVDKDLKMGKGRLWTRSPPSGAGLGTRLRSSSPTPLPRQLSLEQAFSTTTSFGSRLSSVSYGSRYFATGSSSQGRQMSSPLLSSSDEDSLPRPASSRRRLSSGSADPSSPLQSSLTIGHSGRFRKTRSTPTPSISTRPPAPPARKHIPARVAHNPDLSIVPDESERQDVFSSFFHDESGDSNDDADAPLSMFPPRASSPLRAVVPPRDLDPRDARDPAPTTVAVGVAAPKHTSTARLRIPSWSRSWHERPRRVPAPRPPEGAAEKERTTIVLDLSDSDLDDTAVKATKPIARPLSEREVVDLISD